MEIHEIFLASFPIEMYELIKKLTESQGMLKLDNPIVWTSELVSRLESLEDKIAHTVDHWLGQII